ncbi:MAG TPA: hypothetical protein PK916_03670 [Bacteroidota bacterium]|nr:hypothetical protein [Bacteroidota bacterium]
MESHIVQRLLLRDCPHARLGRHVARAIMRGTEVSRLVALLLIACCVLPLASCEDDPVPSKDEFGYSYIVDERDEIARIVGDTLQVTVAYSGCTARHEFSLEARREAAGRMRIWLYKHTPDQDCEMFFYGPHSFALADSLLSSPSLLLVGPQGYWRELR